MAAEDGTEVFENNSMVAQLDAGEYYENPNLNRNTMLTANHPILVAQFSKGFTVPDPTTGRADSVGDPMMIMVAKIGRAMKVLMKRFMKVARAGRCDCSPSGLPVARG